VVSDSSTSKDSIEPIELRLISSDQLGFDFIACFILMFTTFVRRLDVNEFTTFVSHNNDEQRPKFEVFGDTIDETVVQRTRRQFWQVFKLSYNGAAPHPEAHFGRHCQNHRPLHGRRAGDWTIAGR